MQNSPQPALLPSLVKEHYLIIMCPRQVFQYPPTCTLCNPVIFQNSRESVSFSCSLLFPQLLYFFHRQEILLITSTQAQGKLSPTQNTVELSQEYNLYWSVYICSDTLVNAHPFRRFLCSFQVVMRFRSLYRTNKHILCRFSKAQYWCVVGTMKHRYRHGHRGVLPA